MVRPTLAAITTSALMMVNTGLSALIRLVSRRFPEKYEASVASNVPAAQRATFQGLFDQMRNLAGACKQSAEQSKTAMSAFGCTC
jgi:hypothetical protein